MVKQIDKCRVCGSPYLNEFLDLGEQPWCNDFVTVEQVGKEKRYPLKVCLCEMCATPQLTHTVPKEVMYSDHLYLSGPTATMKAHFATVAEKSLSMVGDNPLVLDIGSNDGTLLRTYDDRGADVQGIDPCQRVADIANANGIPTLVRFFDSDTADILKYSKFDIISAANVFYHVEDIHPITEGVSKLLADNGVFVIQGSYWPGLVINGIFDIIYHEHLLYYGILNLSILLGMYDLEIFDVDFVPVHGGSFVAYAGKKKNREVQPSVTSAIRFERENGFSDVSMYQMFAERIAKTRDRIQSIVHGLKNEGKTIFAYGAPAKGTVLLNYCGFSRKQIDCATEKNKLKVGRYIPGTGIPIMEDGAVIEPDYYLMLAWNFRNEFCKSELYLSGKRKFIVPLPCQEIISCQSF